MKIKYYKTTEDEILRWWFGLRDGDCWKINHSPLEIIDDLKTGAKEWYYKGVPLKLKLYAGNI